MTVSKESANDLFIALLRVQKLFMAARHLAQRAHPAVEVVAYPLLFVLVRGPERVSVIADLIHSDVSTVSRQVTHLVKHGLLTKDADPADGRAQVVSLTAEGHAVLRDIQTMRAAWFQQLLVDWEGADVDTFATQLQALADLLDHSLRSRGQIPPPTPINLISEENE